MEEETPQQEIQELQETIEPEVTETELVEEPEPIVKPKKQRSEKQIAAFEKARLKLLEKRALLKSEKEESKQLAKSDKYKSKKKKELEQTIKETLPGIIDESAVVNIINRERNKRKSIKQDKLNEIAAAKKLLGITDEPVSVPVVGVKKQRKKRVTKPKLSAVEQMPDKPKAQIDGAKNYQELNSFLNPYGQSAIPNPQEPPAWASW